MTPVVIYNLGILNKFRINGICLWPFILFSEPRDRCPERLMRHELEHFYQAQRYLVIPFYVLYVGRWLVNLVKYRDTYLAYWRIGFEAQARQAEFFGLSDSERKIFYKEQT